MAIISDIHSYHIVSIDVDNSMYIPISMNETSDPTVSKPHMCAVPWLCDPWSVVLVYRLTRVRRALI